MFDYMTDVSLVEKKTEEVITVDGELMIPPNKPWSTGCCNLGE